MPFHRKLVTASFVIIYTDTAPGRLKLNQLKPSDLPAGFLQDSVHVVGELKRLVARDISNINFDRFLFQD